MKILSELFDPRVVVRTAPIDDGAIARLTEQERAFVAGAGEKRRREFATARVLAREALRELGVEGFDLLNAEDRAPIWPSGIAGTVSHSNTRAVVAVGRADEVGTIGVDVEHREVLPQRLWEMTMLAEEIAWLEARDGADQGALALALFGAKEALYKAQYPRTREYMGFSALLVELSPDARAPLDRGNVRCVFEKDVGPLPKGFVAVGRYRRLETGEMVTAVEIPSLESSGDWTRSRRGSAGPETG